MQDQQTTQTGCSVLRGLVGESKEAEIPWYVDGMFHVLAEILQKTEKTP
jgi:hypothetical protein